MERRLVPWRAARVAHPQARPVPLLLVLEPTLSGWPWSAAVSHAASTLQALGVAQHLDAPGVQATLAFAVELQGVQSVVLCGQGPWAAAGATALRPLAHALRVALQGLCAAPAPPPPVEGLWLETSSGTLHALGTHPASGLPCASQPCSEPLSQLVRAMSKPPAHRS